jgi:hypothetical protein
VGTQHQDKTGDVTDVLLACPNQPSSTTNDLKLADSLERKVKQILVDIHSADLEGKSLTDIRDRVNAVIEGISDAHECPEKVEVITFSNMRNKAILLQLNSKQAANWLRDPANETVFTGKFTKDSYFVDRNYSIIVPRTPITFEPKNVKHLHEIEEVNNLDLNSIWKARWIKPVARRRNGQTHAYAVLTITSPEVANQLIRGGVTICGMNSLPIKLKHEPLQCL